MIKVLHLVFPYIWQQVWGEDEVRPELWDSKLIPNTEDYQRQLQKLIDDTLDQKVAKTDMKVQHIVTKAIEVRDVAAVFEIYFG